MDNEFERQTAPAGDLSEPPRKPPTAVALATPPNPERHRSSVRSISRPLSTIVGRTLDVVDAVADAVARTLNLRPASSRP